MRTAHCRETMTIGKKRSQLRIDFCLVSALMQNDALLDNGMRFGDETNGFLPVRVVKRVRN